MKKTICRSRFTTCSGWYFFPRAICSPCPVSRSSTGTIQAEHSKGAAGSMRRGFTLLFMGLVSLIAVRRGELASAREKARFSTNLRPQQFTDTIAVSCLWLGMVIHRFCDPSVCPAGSNPIRT